MREDSRTIRWWAREEYGHAELGDPRRTNRLVRMAASLAERPGGKILDVFRSNAEQQGAYDLLSNVRVTREAMLAAAETATLRRCAGEPWVHVGRHEPEADGPEAPEGLRCGGLHAQWSPRSEGHPRVRPVARRNASGRAESAVVGKEGGKQAAGLQRATAGAEGNAALGTGHRPGHAGRCAWRIARLVSGRPRSRSLLDPRGPSSRRPVVYGEVDLRASLRDPKRQPSARTPAGCRAQGEVSRHDDARAARAPASQGPDCAAADPYDPSDGRHGRGVRRPAARTHCQRGRCPRGRHHSAAKRGCTGAC
jgi:hypothetical protein